MPKKAKALSALAVSKLTHNGKSPYPQIFAVGEVDGLYLQVSRPTSDRRPPGRSWILRTTIDGKRRSMGLGSYPTVGLKEARVRARAALDKIWAGNNPIEERRIVALEKAREITFREAMDKLLKAKEPQFKNAKHAKQWRSTLETYALPVLGSMNVSEIELRDVLRVLEPIWAEKTETASRLRGRIEAVLAWATVAGHRSGDNPARWRGNLDVALPKPSKVSGKGNWPALSLDEAAQWFADLRKRGGSSARALELVALTASRSGEVRGMTWEELDLKAGIWTVPASRMKADREHRVALPKAAMDLLKAIHTPRASGLVFAAPAGGQLSDMALTAVMRKIAASRPGQYLDKTTGRPAVPHGLRSTFRDWAAECGHDRDMAEMQLAHAVGSKVERAYRRSDMFERRRGMIEAWAAFLKGETSGTVVELRRG